MALKLEEIRTLADRVAASHGLGIVDVEYLGGGGKHRTLRVFIEKNEPERARLRERAGRLLQERESLGTLRDREPEPAIDESDTVWNEDVGDEAEPASGPSEDGWVEADDDAEAFVDQDADEAFLAGLPGVANLEFLSGITHADCESFSRDFGVILDVEELVPGTEYLLEVSSPGLDRRLTHAADYSRFTGSLVKVQTFEPVTGNRHWQGRLIECADDTILLELGGKGQKKAKKGSEPAPERIVITLGNVEKASLVPEF